jgi:hypothetical protein
LLKRFQLSKRNPEKGRQGYRQALERVPDDQLKTYPVSDLVNSPKPDDPRCIEPVRIDWDKFERQWWAD